MGSHVEAGFQSGVTVASFRMRPASGHGQLLPVSGTVLGHQ